MILQTALLATSKVAERTLVSGVLEHPSDPRYGKIGYVIDIPLPLVIGEALEQAIVSTIKNEYFGAERRSPLYQFEDTIKQINLSLAELAESGHNDWVGHVHAAIVLWAENELFVTHAGRVLGVAVRSNALVSFIDGPSNERRILVHKTFANLASGQLSAGDTIILGNGELARHFSPQFLSQIATTSPTESIQSMQAVARRLNLRFVTAIVGLVVETDDDAERTETPTILLQSGGNPPTSRIGGVYTTTLRAARGVGGSKIAQTVKTGAIKTITSLIPATKEAFQALFSTITAKKPVISYEEGAEIPVHSESRVNVETAPVHEAIKTPMLARPYRQKIAHTLSRLLKIVRSYSNDMVRYGKKIPPKVLLGFGIGCIGIVLVSAVTHSRSTTSSPDSPNRVAATVKQARTILDNATRDAASKPDQAREELSNAQTFIDQIRAGGNGHDATTLQDQYTKLIGQLNHVTIITPTGATNLDSKTTDMVVIGQYLFSTRANSPQIFRQTLGQTDAPGAIYSFKSGSIRYMALIDEERKLLVGTTDNKLYRVAIDNQVTATELPAPTGESWLPFLSITSYGDNLYLLEQSSGAIWKYTSRDAISYTSKQAYLASQSLIDPQYTAVVSDGFMYVLKNDGSVTKFLKGAPQSFGPTVIPKPGNTFQNASHIFTSQNTSNLFIQDAHRLVEIAKDGQYVRQYVLADGTITTSFVSPKSKRAWLLQGSKLIEVSL